VVSQLHAVDSESSPGSYQIKQGDDCVQCRVSCVTVLQLPESSVRD